MRSPWLAGLSGFALAAAAVACGGSSSESPWPVEPEHTDIAPVGETAVPGAPLEEKPPESRGELSAEGPDGGRARKKP